MNTLTDEERSEGWELLFAGTPESLSEHWRGFRKDSVTAGWQVADDNTLTFDPEAETGGDLITRGQYENFELQLDWKISEGGNSGIIYLVSEDHNSTWQTGPEMQILDNERHPDSEDPTHRAGAVYDLYAPQPENAVKPAGEWNQVRLVIRDGKVEHWLNGEQVASYDMNSEEFKQRVAESKFNSVPGYAQNDRGHIALQDHSDKVWYRNIKIRPLDGTS